MKTQSKVIMITLAIAALTASPLFADDGADTFVNNGPGISQIDFNGHSVKERDPEATPKPAPSLHPEDPMVEPGPLSNGGSQVGFGTVGNPGANGTGDDTL